MKGRNSVGKEWKKGEKRVQRVQKTRQKKWKRGEKRCRRDKEGERVEKERQEKGGEKG